MVLTYLYDRILKPAKRWHRNENSTETADPILLQELTTAVLSCSDDGKCNQVACEYVHMGQSTGAHQQHYTPQLKERRRTSYDPAIFA